jgi:hypothetical protein
MDAPANVGTFKGSIIITRSKEQMSAAVMAQVGPIRHDMLSIFPCNTFMQALSSLPKPAGVLSSPGRVAADIFTILQTSLLGCW